ncbi:MAG: hypothetical protein D6683_03975 [Actinomyces sp.]|nr:MAG: hypothetical protein D6683_03975 [Actinomyces sp.]
MRENERIVTSAHGHVDIVDVNPDGSVTIEAVVPRPLPTCGCYHPSWSRPGIDGRCPGCSMSARTTWFLVDRRTITEDDIDHNGIVTLGMRFLGECQERVEEDAIVTAESIVAPISEALRSGTCPTLGGVTITNDAGRFVSPECDMGSVEVDLVHGRVAAEVTLVDFDGEVRTVDAFGDDLHPTWVARFRRLLNGGVVDDDDVYCEPTEDGDWYFTL